MSIVRQPVSVPEPGTERERISPEEYLRRERLAPFRSEYVRGYVYPMNDPPPGSMQAMAGASEEHNLIVTNLLRELSLRLKGRPCKTYPSDMKVKTETGDAYFYPDVSVVCGEVRFVGGRRDIYTNPLLVVEVASPSTQRFDQEGKFDDYALLPSLKDYLLVSTDRPSVRHYARQDNGQWLVTLYTAPQAAIALPNLDVELPLSEIYDRVEFETVA